MLRSIATRLVPRAVSVHTKLVPQVVPRSFQLLQRIQSPWRPLTIRPYVVGIKEHEREVEVRIHGKMRRLNFHWLRDHCRCDKCYNYKTFQRNILPHHISRDIYPESASIHDDDTLEIHWRDGHVSHYNLEWLAANSYPGLPPKTPKFLWNGEMMKEEAMPEVDYRDFMKKDHALRTLLQNIVKYGYGVVAHAPISIECTKEVAERVCFIQQTMFGKMWSFTSDMARSDTAYTNIALGAHNDSTYFSMPTGIQVFHCLEHTGKGGETLLVDGFHVAEQLRKTDPDAFKLLTEVEIGAEYIEPPGYHFRALDRILKVHPVTQDLQWIRFNLYDRAPTNTVHPDMIMPFYEALESLSGFVHDPANEFWIKLQPGMVLFIDNFRTFHGRASFTGKRRVCGCYLPRDDWMSRAHVFGLA